MSYYEQIHASIRKIEHLLTDSWKAVAINQENLEFLCTHYDSLDQRRLEGGPVNSYHMPTRTSSLSHLVPNF